METAATLAAATQETAQLALLGFTCMIKMLAGRALQASCSHWIIAQAVLAQVAMRTNSTTETRCARIVRLGGLRSQGRLPALLVLPGRPARRGRIVRRAQTILGLRRVLQSAINAERDTVVILVLFVLLNRSTPFRR